LNGCDAEILGTTIVSQFKLFSASQNGSSDLGSALSDLAPGTGLSSHARLNHLLIVILSCLKVERLMPGMGIRSNVGGLGAAAVTLLRDDDVNVLVDTGHFGTRDWLLRTLKERKIALSDIDVVVLTHLHWDHCLNIDLFRRAKVLLGEAELKEGFLMDPHEPFTGAFKQVLKEKMDVHTVRDGDRISAHTTAMLTPGHSPGHIAVCVRDGGKLTILSGDAVPNFRAYLREFPDISFYSRKMSRESIRKIKALNPEVIIPGHDSPFNNGGYLERDDFTLILRRENEENTLITIGKRPADRPVIHK
jgi:glyoxylase-like metal-dependent hydrolase (beta-lactamase superfamily II)